MDDHTPRKPIYNVSTAKMQLCTAQADHWRQNLPPLAEATARANPKDSNEGMTLTDVQFEKKNGVPLIIVT